MKEKGSIVINSTVLYVMAFLCTTTIHEFAHGLIGLLNGSAPVVHHNYVEHSSNQLSIVQQVSIALAGPLASLIQGILAGWAFLRTDQRRPMQLFVLWLSVLGFNNFFGYLMTGPFFKIGDIGKVHLLLGSSIFIQVAFAILGAGAILFIAYKLTTPFLTFSFRQKWIAEPHFRKNFSFSILILPWIIGACLTTILYLPIVAVVSVIYPFSSGMVFIFPWQNAATIKHVPLAEGDELGRLNFQPMLLLVALILVFRLVLAPGVSL